MSNSDPTLFERLAKVEPAKLARLLVELAAQDQTILEQVQFLLASGDTTAIAKAVRSTLRAWKRSPRFIHYQEACRRRSHHLLRQPELCRSRVPREGEVRTLGGRRDALRGSHRTPESVPVRERLDDVRG